MKNQYEPPYRALASEVFPKWGLKAPQGGLGSYFIVSKRQQQLMINKTVRAVAGVQGVGLALRGAHEPLTVE